MLLHVNRFLLLAFRGARCADFATAVGRGALFRNFARGGIHLLGFVGTACRIHVLQRALRPFVETRYDPVLCSEALKRSVALF